MNRISIYSTNLISLIIMMWMACSCCDDTDESKEIIMSTAIDTVSYCVGQDIAQYITSVNQKIDIEKLDLDILMNGIISTLEGENAITFGHADEFMRSYFEEILPKTALKGSEQFLEMVEKKNHNVRKTESGLLYEIVKDGNNRRPKSGNIVYLMFEGRKRDGSIYESTYNDYQGEESFPFDYMIKGWQEGLSKIGEGGVIKLWIHPDLAYGKTGNEHLGPNQALYYYIELIAVI